MIRAVPLYTFLDHCNSSPLGKEVLECGAGVWPSYEPLLVRFYTIFHMTKADIAIAMREIERVLKPGGLCFVNFLSVDDDACGEGRQLGKGEFVQAEAGGETVHVFHADDEPDAYFSNFDMLHKEKRILERWSEGEKYTQAYIDYIAQKRAEPRNIE